MMSIKKSKKPFIFRDEMEAMIKKNGGWVNAHAHIDRAYSLTKQNWHIYNGDMPSKWVFNSKLQENSSVDQIYDRMATAMESMISQGVTAIGAFIDTNEFVKDKSLKAATKIREKYKKDITIKFINQVLTGVLKPEAREWFHVGAEFADIIGGLPGKDKGHEAEHLDVLMQTAKKMKKMVHVHVDQLNTAAEKETELLARKTIEHKMEGKVAGIHGISLAAHPKAYREKVYKLMEKAKLMMVCCPTVWIDNYRTEEMVPSHNSITPVDEMIPYKLTVAVGTDNISDVHGLWLDGNMWYELRLLMAGTRLPRVDKNWIEETVKIATKNGRKVLGIK